MLYVDKDGIKEVEDDVKDKEGKVYYLDSFDYEMIKREDSEELQNRIKENYKDCYFVDIGVPLGGEMFGHINVLVNEKILNSIESDKENTFTDEVSEILIRNSKYFQESL